MDLKLVRLRVEVGKRRDLARVLVVGEGSNINITNLTMKVIFFPTLRDQINLVWLLCSSG